MYICSAFEYHFGGGVYQYAAGVVPLLQDPVVTFEETPSALVCSSYSGNTVAWIGTEEGNLLKVSKQIIKIWFAVSIYYHAGKQYYDKTYG